MTDMTPDYTAARDYVARVLAYPGQHSTEEVAAARALQHLLPAPTLTEMTSPERADTVGMWAAVDPGDGRDTWRGIIARATRNDTLVCHPDDMRRGMEPVDVPANAVTPDPSVPRAWNADGTPPQPESGSYLDTNQEADPHVPPSTLTVGSKWNDPAALARACNESPRDQIVVIDALGYAYIWSYEAEWWEGSVLPSDAPLTVVHTGFDGTLRYQK